MKLKSYLRGLGTGLFISAVLMGIALSGRTKELSDAEIKTRAKALGMVEENAVLVKPAEEAPDVKNAEDTAEVPEDKEKAEEEAGSGKKDTVAAMPEEEQEPVSEPQEEKNGNAEASKSKDTASDDAGRAAEEASTGDDKDTVREDETGSDEIRDSKEDRAMGGQTEKKSENEKVSGLQNSSGELGYNEFFTIQIASGSSSETVSRLLKGGGAIDNADDFDNYLCKNHYDKKITPGVFKIPVGADYQQIAEIITGGK